MSKPVAKTGPPSRPTSNAAKTRTPVAPQPATQKGNAKPVPTSKPAAKSVTNSKPVTKVVPPPKAEEDDDNYEDDFEDYEDDFEDEEEEEEPKVVPPTTTNINSLAGSDPADKNKEGSEDGSMSLDDELAAFLEEDEGEPNEEEKAELEKIRRAREVAAKGVLKWKKAVKGGPRPELSSLYNVVDELLATPVSRWGVKPEPEPEPEPEPDPEILVRQYITNMVDQVVTPYEMLAELWEDILEEAVKQGEFEVMIREQERKNEAADRAIRAEYEDEEKWADNMMEDPNWQAKLRAQLDIKPDDFMDLPEVDVVGSSDRLMGDKYDSFIMDLPTDSLQGFGQVAMPSRRSQQSNEDQYLYNTRIQQKDLDRDMDWAVKESNEYLYGHQPPPSSRRSQEPVYQPGSRRRESATSNRRSVDDKESTLRMARYAQL